MGSDSAVQTLREAFVAAPLAEAGWETALRDMARLTRSARGQLVAFDGGPVFALDIITDFDDAFQDQFAQINGSDPHVNWRVHSSGAPLEVISERHYSRSRQRRRFDDYDDFVAMADIPNGCQTVLVQEKDSFFGLAVLRTRADGPSSEDDQALFAAIVTAAQTGVRLQRRLAHQGAELIAGALEAMDSAALLLNRHGGIIAQTPAAEGMLARQTHVQARRGRLSAASAAADQRLQAAIALAVGGGGGLSPQSLWLDAREIGQTGQACEVFSLPRRDWSFGELPHALVVLQREPAFGARHKALLGQALGLSAGEAEVALMTARGLGREQIARSRGVSAETVATQLKHIYGKADVHSGLELAALLRDML